MGWLRGCGVLVWVVLAVSCDDGTSSPADAGRDGADTAGDLAVEGAGDVATDVVTDASTDGDGSAPLRVAMAFDGAGRGDLSFNDTAAAGLDRAGDELPIVTSEYNSEDYGGTEVDAYEGALRAASEDADLVLAVGFAYSDAAVAVSADFPDVRYAVLDGEVDADHVASVLFAAHEGSFLVGAAAALKSEARHVGFIGGVQFPVVTNFQAGFEAGARHIDADVQIDVAFVSTDFTGFNDPAAAQAIAQGMFENGADVVFHAAGGSGVGLFRAARDYSEAESHVWAIGVDADQYFSVGDTSLQPYILTSMLKRLDVAVFDIIQETLAGEFQDGVRVLGLEQGGVSYATSGGFVDDIAEQLDALAAQIVSGEIVVPDQPGE